MFKISAVALALSAVAFSASAMTSIEDADLSQVTGQDGVTIAGDLNINIGAFTWTDTDTNGGSVSFNNISIKGMFIQTIDVLNNATFKNTLATSFTAYTDAATGAALATAAMGYVGTTDVVQFAFPALGLPHAVTPTITIASITNSGSSASYGKLEIKNLDLQGTKIWLWAH